MAECGWGIKKKFIQFRSAAAQTGFLKFEFQE
jgi:hypothetical protein